jgi:hypothetical protein
MSFNETLIYRILSIPGKEFEKDCGYFFMLKVPMLFLIMLVGVPMALIFDIFSHQCVLDVRTKIEAATWLTNTRA